MQRRNRTDNGGGIATFMRTDIPAKHEVTLDKVKWLIFALYSAIYAKQFIYQTQEYIIGQRYQILWKFNCYRRFKLWHAMYWKSQTLDDLCDLFDLTNIIKEPTCFKKDCNPSLVDVILTNESKSGFKSLNFNTGVSDCHHLISTFIKGNIPICENIKQL